jgi:hypothetical protein
MASPSKFAHVVFNTHRYEEMIGPVGPIRHGPTLSLYYADPDGNHLEFQIDVLEAEAANRFMRGPAFGANPIGELFDPDELVARFEAGAPVDGLVFRSDQTPVPLAGVHRAGTPA